MKERNFVTGEFYHLFSRGVRKQTLFEEKSDWFRFLLTIILFQSTEPLPNFQRLVSEIQRQKTMTTGILDRELIKSISRKKNLKLAAFGLMPNHFHLLAQQTAENGISKYMQRVNTSYAKYYNTKYEQTGHLFQSKFQAVHIENNNQLLYLSAYIHKNCRELTRWKNREEEYPWSSLQDYIQFNRWGALLETETILEQFSGPQEYAKWVKESAAKEL